MQLPVTIKPANPISTATSPNITQSDYDFPRHLITIFPSFSELQHDSLQFSLAPVIIKLSQKVRDGHLVTVSSDIQTDPTRETGGRRTPPPQSTLQKGGTTTMAG